MKGIYKYIDLKTGNIVYVGKDSNINKNQRHKAHLQPSTYDKQPFNRALQNNPDRYEYSIIWATEDCTPLNLNKMEILFGKIYNPKFNYGKFGKGGCNGHTDETKQKISKNNDRYWEGKSFSDEHKQKLSDSHKGKPGYWEDKSFSDEHKQNISISLSESNNTSGYYRVHKKKDNTCKQGFLWVYRYHDKKGRRKQILSVDIKKLEKKVKAKGLEWREF